MTTFWTVINTMLGVALYVWAVMTPGTQFLVSFSAGVLMGQGLSLAITHAIWGERR